MGWGHMYWFLASLLEIEVPKLEETEGKAPALLWGFLSMKKKCMLCLLEAAVKLAFNYINI